MTLRLDGLEQVQKNLRQWGINADKELGQIVRATTLAVQAEAVKSIQQGTKSGETYQKYNPRRSHTASAPGEAPASDTGRGAGSINVRFIPSLGGLFTGVVFTPLDYMADLEVGTQDIAARPWLFPALESQRRAWRQRLDKLVDKAAEGIHR